MEVLVFNKTLLKVLAIWPTVGFSFLNWTIVRLFRYISILVLFLLILASCVTYSLKKIDDIVESTSAAYPALAFFTSLSTYCALIYNKERVHVVITKLQALVMTRKTSITIQSSYVDCNSIVVYSKERLVCTI